MMIIHGNRVEKYSSGFPYDGSTVQGHNTSSLSFLFFLRVETAKREMFSQNSVRWFALICHRSTTPGFSYHF